MAVPITGTKLSDVITELELPSNSSLADCFAAANDAGFDPTYEGSKDRLSNFRNYQNVINMSVTNAVQGTLYTGFLSSTSVNKTQLFIADDGLDMLIQQDKGNVEFYKTTQAWNIGSFVYQGYHNEHTNDPGWYGAWYQDARNGWKVYSRSNKIIHNRYNADWDCSPYTRIGEEIMSSATQRNIIVRDDGKRMWVVRSNYSVAEYAMSTAWNIATSVLVQNWSWSSSYGTTFWFIFFNDDYSRMFVGPSSAGKVLQFNLSTPGTISGSSTTPAAQTSSSSFGTFRSAFKIPGTTKVLFNSYNSSGGIREWDFKE